MSKLLLLLFLAVFHFACGSSGSITESKPEPPRAADQLAQFSSAGHAHYVGARYDSACFYLEKARAIDHHEPRVLMELGESYYAMGMELPNGTQRERNLRMALDRYATIDSIGKADAGTYERLTEVSHLLGDTQLFVHYAEKQAAVHPGDRELYNLGLAYFDARNYQKTIETQKGAIQKYPHSPYIGGFYRLLGDGYYEIDRQQTAERTYQEGVKVVDSRVADMKGANSQFSTSSEYRQLADSRRSMLLSLKKLYRLHGKKKELDEVDRLLEKDP